MRATPLGLRASALLGLVAALRLGALPPLPHHVVFGVVRDEFGVPLTASGGEITLETLEGKVLRSSVTPGLAAGVNYRMEVPMDAGLTSGDYVPTATRPTAPFRMKVTLGTRSYVPMELKVNWARLGQPAHESRVDLTLGEDTDGDGLPDAWERAMIQTGRLNMGIGDFSPTHRINGNALTVMESYRAGTYAWDPKDGFRLDIQGMDAGGAMLQFTALRGRSYTVVGSDDLKSWNPVSFRVHGEAGSDRSFYQTTVLKPVRVIVQGKDGGAAPKFFRLMVN